MTINKIQDGIIKEKEHLYTDTLFAYDIRKCTSLLELVAMLGQYGYDRQGALGVLNSVIVTTEWVPSLSDEEINEMVMDEWERKL